MTFTQEDAENDGLIKREVGQELNAVLSRQGSELYRLFTEWCDETGRSPSRVLGDMALRSMRDEGFAQELSGVVIDLGKLKSNQIREEDLDMVMDLIDKLDDKGDDDGGAMNTIDKMIEQRIEAMGSGPLGGVADNVSNNRDNRRQDGEISQMEERIERIEQAVIGQQQQQNNTSEPQQTGGGGQGVDELFDSLSGSGGEPDDETQQATEGTQETDESPDGDSESEGKAMFSTDETIET
jgi:hypothetical protein